MILKRQEKENIIKALYDSSNIVASTYNTENSDLIIIFKSGTQYKYPNVSKSDYMRFEIAESQGKVFNTHIKKYTFEKLDNVDIGTLLDESSNLKEQEETALYEAKRLNIMDKINYLVHINDKILNEQDNKQKTNELFLNKLSELQVLIGDFLMPKESD